MTKKDDLKKMKMEILIEKNEQKIRFFCKKDQMVFMKKQEEGLKNEKMFFFLEKTESIFEIANRNYVRKGDKNMNINLNFV